MAGTAGGRSLQVPGSGTRPTSERVREALFSRLEHLDVVRGARVLDLYAGSGALGLEAASRGAVHVVLVDAAKKAADLCRRNAAALGLRDRVEVVAAKARTYLDTAAAAPADLALLDPPYDVGEDDLAGVLTSLAAPGRWLTDGAVVVVERSKKSPEPTWPAALTPLGPKTYGDTAVWFAEHTATPALP